jgi:NADH:ubiquinone oxidoreductase subunit 6 (subunit J)
MLHILITAAALACAIQAVRAGRLLASALWLAGASALVALEMYLLGAPEIAVIELSVGAGLVTVLLVFAINLTGEENIDARHMFPRPLAWALLALAGILLLVLILPGNGQNAPTTSFESLREVFWQDRQLDTLLQILMILAGVLGVLGLLSEEKTARRERRL